MGAISPKFNTATMLVLGAVIGLLASILVFASQAASPNAVPVAASGSVSPAAPTAESRITVSVKIKNSGTANMGGTSTYICIGTGTVCSNDGDILGSNSDQAWEPTDSIAAGSTRTVTVDMIPQQKGTWEIFTCADIYSNATESNENDNCLKVGTFVVGPSNIDLKIAGSSFGPSYRAGSASVDSTYAGNWLAFENETLNFYFYVKNHGSTSIGDAFSVQVCVDPLLPDYCTIEQAQGTYIVESASTIGAGRTKWFQTGAVWKARLGVHTVWVCPDPKHYDENGSINETIETRESRDTECTTMIFEVVPRANVSTVYNRASSAVGSAAPDGYGTDSFDQLLGSVLNPYRPVCPGFPNRTKCNF